MRKILLSSFMCVCYVTMIYAQERNITGKVTSSEDGTSLPGVNVILKGTTTGTTTDNDGSFSINVPESGGTLVLSFIGFMTEEIAVANQSVFDIRLRPDITQLSEVVVVGFGETERRKLTGAVSSINSDQFRNFNAQSVDQLLQGRSAGVAVSSTGGFLGAPITVRVRGVSSIQSSSQPLYIVDGVPVNSDVEGSNLGSGTGGGMNSLVNLNPNDIASIEILKDAAATAIYGARASNGVVLITTKRGKTGEPRINVNYYAGQTDHTKIPEYLNGQEFTEVWNAGITNFAAGQSDPSDYDVYKLDPSDVVSTDWIDLVTRKGFTQEFSANVSGGSDKTTYYVGGTFNTTENYIIDNDMTRYNLIANVTQKLSDRFQLEMKLQPSRSELSRAWESNSVQGPLSYGGLIYPNVPYRDDETGELIVTGGPNPFGLPFNSTPLIDIKESEFNTTVTQVLSNLALQYQVTPWLKLRSEGGVEHWQAQEIRKDGQRTTNGAPTGLGAVTNTQVFNWNINNIATINTQIGNDHDFDITLGNQMQKFVRDAFNATGNGFASDKLKTLNAAAVITGAGGTGTAYSFVGWLGRINYTFKDRYLIGLIGRADGSSRFTKDNQWGFFPAVSLGWIMSDESFLENSQTINFLKLRTSLGKQGNAELQTLGADQNFGALPLFGLSFYNDQGGLTFTQLGNNNLRWESTTQFDAGIDFSLFNRLRGSLGYFKKTTEDLLLAVPTSATVGQVSYNGNVGKMENVGYELELNGDIVATNDFKWNIGFNISTFKNEVTDLPDTDRDGNPNDIINGENLVRVGEPLGAFYVVPWAGVDPENGDALWYDKEGNTTNVYSISNRQVVATPYPDYYGGFINTISFKGIELRAFFQYSVGNFMYVSEGEYNQTGISSIFNQLRTQLDYWSPENPNASQPQPRGSVLAPGNGTQAQNGRYLQDASYMRLKTISLAYQLPPSLVGNKLSLRVFAQGQNLWTLQRKDFTGYDVEGNFSANDNVSQANTFFGAPSMKQFTVGFNLGF